MAVRMVLWATTAAVGLAVSDIGSESSITERDGEELVGGLIVMVLFSCLGGIVYLLEVRTWRGTIVGGIAMLLWFAGYLAWIGGQGEESGMAGVLIVGAPFAALAPVVAVVAWERLSAGGARVTTHPGGSRS